MSNSRDQQNLLKNYSHVCCHFDCILKSGKFGVLSCQNPGQPGANPGHPGRSGMGGNPKYTYWIFT